MLLPAPRRRQHRNFRLLTQDLLELDEVDPIRAALVQELTVLIEYSELELIGAIESAREFLGRRHQAISRLIGVRNIGILVSECDPGALTELAAEMKRAPDAKKGEAAAKLELPPSGSGIVRRGRMISKKEAESIVLEGAAAAFLVVSDQVDNAAASVVSARHQLHEAE